MMAWRALLTGWLIVIALARCNAEDHRVAARVAALERAEEAAQRRLDSRQADVRESERRLDMLNSELTEHNGRMHAYIVQHQTAAACIRAAAATLADDNEYRAQVGAMARLGTVLCTVALLNGRFANEVTAVANALAQADSHARELKNQIAALQRTIEADRSRIHDDQEQLDRIAGDLAQTRQGAAPSTSPRR